MCILSVHTLLNVVGYFDFSVLSMSVMGLKKKVWMGWVGGVSSIQVFFWIFGIFLTLQSPLRRSSMDSRVRSLMLSSHIYPQISCVSNSHAINSLQAWMLLSQ